MKFKSMGAAKLVALAVIVLAAFGMSSVAAAAGGVAGTYRTTIKSPAELKGKWELRLAKNGSYAVAWNGRIVSRGSYSATAKTITWGRERGGSGCTGRGTYAWKRSGNRLHLTRKREAASCQARAMVLAHRFTRVR